MVAKRTKTGNLVLGHPGVVISGKWCPRVVLEVGRETFKERVFGPFSGPLFEVSVLPCLILRGFERVLAKVVKKWSKRGQKVTLFGPFLQGFAH